MPLGDMHMEQTESFLSRRKLMIGAGAASAAAVALVASPFKAAIGTSARDLVRNQPVLRRLLLSLANASYSEWADQIGSIFSAGGGTNLKLVAVSAMPAPGDRPRNLGRDNAFLASFDVQHGATMAGDLIYTLSHASYGPFSIFLSASSNPRMPYRMTALFN
jgi:hypothetical protein